ncbi:hypothetical protein LTS18_001996 [Coniosporium uncinatum]|uniref:Uncharacterized protein n=1 Tax=Coniosporium uncinatum TaxID=93489 RepID=A0ACC3DZP4_9PEZI|nr:hypothetical protein LTS18_001996 [Coniosporium uncinatum]
MLGESHQKRRLSFRGDRADSDGTSLVYNEADDRSFMAETSYIALAKAYILGETLQDDHFEDTVLDAIVSLFLHPAHTWAPEATPVIYAGTAPGSSARKLVVDFYTYASKPTWFSEHAQQHHPEDFLHDLCLSFVKQKNGLLNPDAPFQNRTCVYHSHWGKGKVCYKASGSTNVLAKPPMTMFKRTSGMSWTELKQASKATKEK